MDLTPFSDLCEHPDTHTDTYTEKKLMSSTENLQGAIVLSFHWACIADSACGTKEHLEERTFSDCSSQDRKLSQGEAVAGEMSQQGSVLTTKPDNRIDSLKLSSDLHMGTMAHMHIHTHNQPINQCKKN